MDDMPGWFDTTARVVILYSLGTYFVELELSTADNTRVGPLFFLWSERVVATLFTIEFIVRWWRDPRYPMKPIGIIDLLAVLPFYVGFFAPSGYLRTVRTLRVLRLFKLSRYNKTLCNVCRSFHTISKQLKIIGLLVAFFLIFGSTAVYECERTVQPDRFRVFSDAIWWCVITLTTVGYGDLYPVTAGGRFVAGIILVAGLGLFGTFVSLVGSAFTKAMEQENPTPMADDQLERLAELLAMKLRERG